MRPLVLVMKVILEEVMLVLVVRSVLVGMLVLIVILVLVVKSKSLRCSNNNNYKNNSRQQTVPISAACGQVVSGVVNLTANLNCGSGDGIIVGGPNTVINMNGFSITGPGQDRL